MENNVNKEKEILGKEIVDNKTEVPMSHYLEKYKELDPHEASDRCKVNFNENESAFEITVFNTPLLIAYPEFEIKIQGECAYAKVFDSPYAKMLIIRYLIEKCSAPFTGKFMTYREMPWGEVYDKNFNGRCILRLAYGFGSRIDAFSAACEKLGGRKLSHGDASYELPVFENMIIRLVIYEGDDEFPPTSQFLFSDNMAVSFTAEDRAVFGDLLIDSIKILSSK